MNLGDYIRAAAERPTTGIVPCALFAADWVVLCGHDDPFAFMRGDNEREAMRKLVAARGVLGLAERGMEGLALPRVDEPQLGDVGVIEAPTDDGVHQACAIYGDGRWVTLGLRGIEAGPAQPLAIWRP